MAFAIEFFGVRGTLACAAPAYQRYGSNTSCVAVYCDRNVLILDGGTGSFTLGQQLLKNPPDSMAFFLTHFHWDHIQGLPFFPPAFRAGQSIPIHACGLLETYGGVRKLLTGQMSPPFCPIQLDFQRGFDRFVDFEYGDILNPADGIEVLTAPLNHPQGATGYRINYQGRSVCYITDTEHVPGKPDTHILGLIEGADVVIYDAAYQDEIFDQRIGWGHSTWQEAVRLCKQANVRKLLLFHHDPTSTDPIIDAIVLQAKAQFPAAEAAVEGMIIDVAGV